MGITSRVRVHTRACAFIPTIHRECTCVILSCKCMICIYAMHGTYRLVALTSACAMRHACIPWRDVFVHTHTHTLSLIKDTHTNMDRVHDMRSGRGRAGITFTKDTRLRPESTEGFWNPKNPGPQQYKCVTAAPTSFRVCMPRHSHNAPRLCNMYMIIRNRLHICHVVMCVCVCVCGFDEGRCWALAAMVCDLLWLHGTQGEGEHRQAGALDRQERCRHIQDVHVAE
jgi:hypothetical protein